MKDMRVFLFGCFLAVMATFGFCEIANSMDRPSRENGPQKKVPAQKPMLTEEIRRFLSQQPAAYPRKKIDCSGVAAAEADLSSKSVWLTVIDGPAKDVAVGGFYSVSIKNASSQPWPGVTVSADIEISYAEGLEVTGDGVIVTVYEDGRQVGSASNALYFHNPGGYHLVSRPFAMNPGREYYAVVDIMINAKSGKVKGVIGAIPAIKWSI